MAVFLAKREFLARYVGTIAGSIWALVYPLLTVFIFWFIFSVGFKVKGPGDLPFVLYFICGLTPWLMFNEVLSSSTDGIRQNLSLIKKTVFPSEILPWVYILSAIVSHIIFILIAISLVVANGIPLSLYILQLPFYLFAMCFFLTGLCWIVSALNVFYRDIGQAVPIILNFWFWMTPLVWTIEMIPAQYHWILKINPIVFVVEGYRNSLLYRQPIWADLQELGYFLILSTIVFAIGAIIFSRFKLEFADAI